MKRLAPLLALLASACLTAPASQPMPTSAPPPPNSTAHALRLPQATIESGLVSQAVDLVASTRATPSPLEVSQANARYRLATLT